MAVAAATPHPAPPAAREVPRALARKAVAALLAVTEKTVDNMVEVGAFPKPSFYAGRSRLRRSPRWWDSVVFAWMKSKGANVKF
jgi:predicted DNA-binding transcriptional regulator AlpA